MSRPPAHCPAAALCSTETSLQPEWKTFVRVIRLLVGHLGSSCTGEKLTPMSPNNLLQECYSRKTHRCCEFTNANVASCKIWACRHCENSNAGVMEAPIAKCTKNQAANPQPCTVLDQ